MKEVAQRITSRAHPLRKFTREDQEHINRIRERAARRIASGEVVTRLKSAGLLSADEPAPEALSPEEVAEVLGAKIVGNVKGRRR